MHKLLLVQPPSNDQSLKLLWGTKGLTTADKTSFCFELEISNANFSRGGLEDKAGASKPDNLKKISKFLMHVIGLAFFVSSVILPGG